MGKVHGHAYTHLILRGRRHLLGAACMAMVVRTQNGHLQTTSWAELLLCKEAQVLSSTFSLVGLGVQEGLVAVATPAEALLGAGCVGAVVKIAREEAEVAVIVLTQW